MKGKLILLASVSLNLLVMCTYSECASSVKLYQLSNISRDSVQDNNSTVVQLTTTSSTDALESVHHLHIEEEDSDFKSPDVQQAKKTVTTVQGESNISFFLSYFPAQTHKLQTPHAFHIHFRGWRDGEWREKCVNFK